MTEFCVICGEMTNQRFNMDFKEIPICKDCERSLVKQSISAMHGDNVATVEPVGNSEQLEEHDPNPIPSR